jgi:hypothetical protein
MSGQKPNPSNNLSGILVGLIMSGFTIIGNNITAKQRDADNRKERIEAEERLRKERLEAKAFDDYQKPLSLENVQIFLDKKGNSIINILFSDRLNSFSIGGAVKLVEVVLKTSIKNYSLTEQMDFANAEVFILCCVYILREKLGFVETINILKKGGDLIERYALREVLLEMENQGKPYIGWEEKNFGEVIMPYAILRYPELFRLLEKEN